MLTPLVDGRVGSSPLILFPHAGGSPRFFHHWAGVLAATPVLGVTYPGRDARLEESYADNPRGDGLVALAASSADAISGAGITAPLLVGHSFGAYVAYETAAELCRRGAEGVRVVVSGQNAPEQRPTTRLHLASDDELVSDMVRQNPQSAALWELDDLRRMFLPAVREDYRLLETYEPSAAVVPELLVCHGDRDSEVLPDVGRAWARYARCAGPPEVLSGGHFYLQSPDEQLPRLLMRCFGLR